MVNSPTLGCLSLSAGCSCHCHREPSSPVQMSHKLCVILYFLTSTLKYNNIFNSFIEGIGTKHCTCLMHKFPPLGDYHLQKPLCPCPFGECV